MSKSIHASTRAAALVSLLALAAGTACTSNADENVSPKIAVTNRSKSALVAAGITALDGTYGASCDGRTLGEAWSVTVSGAPVLANPTLSVRKNDSDCTLTVTNVVVDQDVYVGTPAITLATSYAGSASAFKDVPGDPVDFFANARISASSFATDFTIDVLVTDDTNDGASASKQGEFATQSSTVAASNLAAPNYTMGLSSFTMLTDVDDVVTSVGGYAQLVAGTTTGQTYAIHGDLLTSSATLAEIASAYSGAAVSGNIVDLTLLRIPAADFDVVGADLTAAPAVRTVILRNEDQGVISYQLVGVSFSKP